MDRLRPSDPSSSAQIRSEPCELVRTSGHRIKILRSRFYVCPICPEPSDRRSTTTIESTESVWGSPNLDRWRWSNGHHAPSWSSAPSFDLNHPFTHQRATTLLPPPVAKTKTSGDATGIRPPTSEPLGYPRTTTTPAHCKSMPHTFTDQRENVFTADGVAATFIHFSSRDVRAWWDSNLQIAFAVQPCRRGRPAPLDWREDGEGK